MEATKARESGHAGDKKTLKNKLFLVHVDIFRFSIQTAERGLVSVFYVFFQTKCITWYLTKAVFTQEPWKMSPDASP